MRKQRVDVSAIGPWSREFIDERISERSQAVASGNVATVARVEIQVGQQLDAHGEQDERGQNGQDLERGALHRSPSHVSVTIDPYPASPLPLSDSARLTVGESPQVH